MPRYQTTVPVYLGKGRDDLDFYRVSNVLLPSAGGTTTISWDGPNGEQYVASVKVRQELDPMYRDPIWLIENYLEKERTMADIADQFGVSATAINQWLNKHNIETRSRGHNDKQ
jgi:hypothetical protein|tara:strand:+ start:3674 stop:4015 length:342 start_codon:yes stop_codon:yes gene_type:complete